MIYGKIFNFPTMFSMTRPWWRCLHKGSEFWVGLDRRLPLGDCKARCLRHCFGKCRTSCCKNPSSGSTPISSHWSWARFGGWLGTEIKIKHENPWRQKNFKAPNKYWPSVILWGIEWIRGLTSSQNPSDRLVPSGSLAFLFCPSSTPRQWRSHRGWVDCTVQSNACSLKSKFPKLHSNVSCVNSPG